MCIPAVSTRILLIGFLSCAVPLPAICGAESGFKVQVQRGELLTIYGGCNDCHTPKVMTPNGPEIDKTKLLSGHPSLANIPAALHGVLVPAKWGVYTSADMTAWRGPWGISFAANLTPDDATGLGRWTPELFIKSMRTGKYIGGGRPLFPHMLWMNGYALSNEDLHALFAYLKSVKPVSNQVLDPVQPK